MRDLGTVISFTMKEMIKRKSFLISNLIILLLIVVGFNIPNVLNQLTKEGEKEEDLLLIIDSQNVFEGQLEQLSQKELGTNFEVTKEQLTIEQMKEKIDKEEIYAAIEIRKEEGKIQLEYIVDSVGIGGVPTELIETFSKFYTNLQIKKLELNEEQLQKIQPSFDMKVTQVNENPANGNVFAIMLLSLVLFYAIYFCAYQVSSSITTEKTSKIMETLVTSTTPRTIVLGKTIGIGIVGLLQVATILIVAVTCCHVFLEEEVLARNFRYF